MPLNKNAYLRYRLIDSLLREYEVVKTSTIKEKLYDRHDISVGDTTIQGDIRCMTTDLNAPIEYCNSKKAHYYPENVDEIFPIIELIGEEVNALLFYAKTINQYQDYPIFHDISNATKKVIDASNIPNETKNLFEQQTLIETEKHPPLSGIELIAGLLESISKRTVIEIEYKRFNKEPKKHLIKPLLLKEDKLMWYIIGLNKKYDSLITFGLDRIKSLKTTGETFDKVEFNSAEYFKYSFGITVSEEKAIEVVISFEPEQGNYLKTLPIHSTQKILIDTVDEFIIQITIKPSYEFYSKIRSYGSQAIVLSPKHVARQIQTSFEKAVKLYKSNV